MLANKILSIGESNDSLSLVISAFLSQMYHCLNSVNSCFIKHRQEHLQQRQKDERQGSVNTT